MRSFGIFAILDLAGPYLWCGSGGSFCVLEGDQGPEPLLIAGGAALGHTEKFGRGNIKNTAIENEEKTSSGKQLFFEGDKHDVYCAGAGYSVPPQVSNLAEGCVPPKTYKDGLTGGMGLIADQGYVRVGGFGGGGALYWRKVNGKEKCYCGGAGGYTGGNSKIVKKTLGLRFIPERDSQLVEFCYGGGGGSFSADPNATFDHQYVQYGYCKIQRQMDQNRETLSIMK